MFKQLAKFFLANIFGPIPHHTGNIWIGCNLSNPFQWNRVSYGAITYSSICLVKINYSSLELCRFRSNKKYLIRVAFHFSNVLTNMMQHNAINWMNYTPMTDEAHILTLPHAFSGERIKLLSLITFSIFLEISIVYF
jgi:hypothetical protein